MKIQVNYNFSDALSKSIYVKRGVRKDGELFTLSDKDVSETTRAAALTALVSQDGSKVFQSPEEAGVNTRATEAFKCYVAIQIHIGPVDVEPTPIDVAGEAEVVLVKAAVAASAVVDQIAALKAQAAVNEAWEKEEAILSLLSAPISEWLRRDHRDFCLVGEYQKVIFSAAIPSRTSDLIALDPRLAARVVEAQAEADRLNAEHDAARRLVLVSHGRADQVERFDADVLPEEELRHVAMQKFFGGINLPTYKPIDESKVQHSDDCDRPDARFCSSDHDGKPLTSAQWASLKKVRAAAPEGSEVSVREHRGWCNTDACDASGVTRYGVRVSISWAGLVLVQEYACG